MLLDLGYLYKGQIPNSSCWGLAQFQIFSRLGVAWTNAQTALPIFFSKNCPNP